MVIWDTREYGRETWRSGCAAPQNSVVWHFRPSRPLTRSMLGNPFSHNSPCVRTRSRASLDSRSLGELAMALRTALTSRSNCSTSMALRSSLISRRASLPL